MRHRSHQPKYMPLEKMLETSKKEKNLKLINIFNDTRIAFDLQRMDAKKKQVKILEGKEAEKHVPKRN